MAHTKTDLPDVLSDDSHHCPPNYANYDVLRKINALLENKLDLASLSGITLPHDQAQAAMPAVASQPAMNTAAPMINTAYQMPCTSQLTSPVQMNTTISPSDAWASYLNSLGAAGHSGAIGGNSLPGSHQGSLQDIYQATNANQCMQSQQPMPVTSTVMNNNTGYVQSTNNGALSQQPYYDNWLDLAAQGIAQYTLGQVAAAQAALAQHQSQLQQLPQQQQQQTQQQQQQQQQTQLQQQQQQQQTHQQQHNQLYNQQMQQQQHNAAMAQQSMLSPNSESFIPGAISNRTLETLTESSMRPYRAIRGDASNYTSSQNDYSRMTGCQTGVGTIGDRMSPDDTRSLSRSTSPADSDTSGYSSAQSEYSDSALIELMKNLQIPSSQTSLDASQQQTYQQQNIKQLASLASADLLKSLGLPADICRRLQTPSLTQSSVTSNPNDFSMSADLFASRPCHALNTLFSTSASDPQSIERAAKLYRNAATICEPTCTWSGQLPAKNHKSPCTYSCKAFLGGVPWDINESGLQHAFRPFGNIKVEWPSKEGKHPRYAPKAGYVYVLFDNDKSVKALLQSCTHDFSNGGEYYFKISSRRMRSKEVQVIPWSLGDSNYVKQPSQRLDPQKTVFVGALHGMMNAEGLAVIMNDLFGNVLYAGIDTDKHKYPIGSGRVTFSSHKSYMKAVNAAFVEIKASKFTKKIQIDPYLEDSKCSSCNVQQGPYFCRDLTCFRYYCKSCWQWYHSSEVTSYHKPLMRNGRAPSGGVSGLHSMS